MTAVHRSAMSILSRFNRNTLCCILNDIMENGDNLRGFRFDTQYDSKRVQDVRCSLFDPDC